MGDTQLTGWSAVLFGITMIAGTAVPAQIQIDRFENLGQWRSLTVAENGQPSVYAGAAGGDTLDLSSSGGGSMLIWPNPVDVNSHRYLSWRWRVIDPVPDVRPTRAEEDDAPLRVYVSFVVPMEERRPTARLWARLQERRFGVVPPEHAISFLWAPADMGGPNDPLGFVYPSPFTDRQYNVVIAPVSQPGQWVTYEVDLLVAYRRLFGEDPPREAYLAIMGDSDNSGQSGRGQIDFVSLTAERRAP